MGEIIDVRSDSGQKPVKEESKKITAERLKEIQGIADNIRHIREAIGAIEEQQAQMIAQSIGMKNKIESDAKKMIVEAGIKEEEAEKYKIDLQTGEIVPQSR